MQKDTIKLRNQGELVKLLQHRLQELGYTIDTDGYFGNETEKIVKQFQKDNKLKQDGIIGKGSWELLDKLFSEKKNTQDLNLPIDRNISGSIRKGDKGDLVKRVQEMLLELGYIIAVDGIFGAGTERVIRQFQKDNHLIEDGVVGVHTYQILSERVLNSKKNDPVPKLAKVDRAFFFQKIKENNLFKNISQSQVDGLNFILDRWEVSNLKDLRWLAYIFATTKHETANTMQPIEEYGKGKGRPYGNKIKMNGSKYTLPDKIYYGRGYVQLTWFENYDKMGRVLGKDLLNKPELALDAVTAADIMIEGMTLGITAKGDFTGKSLENYFNGNTEDWVNARKIINGLDKADLIAGYGKKFYQALRLGS